jgi:hypothetical protein
LGYFDFQIAQLATRSVIPEGKYSQIPLDNIDAWNEFFDLCVRRQEAMLRALMTYNEQTRIFTFVANHLVPQQNPNGRLLPKYDIRNPVYFSQRLNKQLTKLTAARHRGKSLPHQTPSALVGGDPSSDYYSGICSPYRNGPGPGRA